MNMLELNWKGAAQKINYHGPMSIQWVLLCLQRFLHMFKFFRIFILLLIFAGVALGAWREKTRSVEWKYTLPVNVYPINADGSEVTAEYIHSLKPDDFKPIEKFMKDEAARYGRDSHASIEIKLGSAITKLPPSPPHSANPLEIILWSLQMRWWSFRHAETYGPGPQVKLFLLYFDPASRSRLGHSTGLQKGLLGNVNLYAAHDMAGSNNVVIVHEFLHTLGATDKYDLMNNQPIYPDGYAIPDQTPLLPQRFAEIMAGRIPISENKAEIPTGLNETLIGEKTAREINWVSL